MLILKRVRQFVCHHRLLAFELDPIGKVKLLCLRIVITRHLFS